MSWPMVKLGDYVTHISSGATPRGGSENYSDSGPVMFLRSQNIHMNELRLDDVIYVSDDIHEKMARSEVRFGDVLLNITGASIGRVVSFELKDKKVNSNQHVCTIRPKSEALYYKYLSYFLGSESFQREIFSSQRGGTREALNYSQVRDFRLPLPPLAEQKRIAAILDKADAVRRKRQQAIQLADDFLRAVFLEMFGDPVTNPKGWELKPLKAVLTSISSGWSANGDSRPCEEGELGVLKISAVTSGTFISTENKAVQVSDIPSSKKLVFPKKGDMLFSRANTRELVAASCIVADDSLNTFLPDKLWLIKTDESQLQPEFLNYLLKIPGFKEKLTSQATGSSGSMLNISMGKFEQTDCLIPPIDLQHRFKNLYWKLQETLSSFGQSESTLQASFNSLSQKAFSGQL